MHIDLKKNLKLIINGLKEMIPMKSKRKQRLGRGNTTKRNKREREQEKEDKNKTLKKSQNLTNLHI